MSKVFQKADGWVKLPVNVAVYPLQSIHSAGYVYMDRAYVRLDEGKKGIVDVWLAPKVKGKENDLDQLALDFSQELLNYAHYFSSLKTNAEGLKLLLQRALFSASPALVKEAEDKEIEDLIKELEAEEVKTGKSAAKKRKK
ncbi:MAG: hypothetical protein HQL22_07510 [Candidatus Omnitrophica bacterium]|nr:hypothetical protein [Candidatus Omnitrophota bacterium]